jgi:hypothetical protein
MKNEISFPGSPALWAGSFTFYETIFFNPFSREYLTQKLADSLKAPDPLIHFIHC